MIPLKNANKPLVYAYLINNNLDDSKSLHNMPYLLE